MLNDWALDNLQVIRALMESSAIYRRAVAPVMGAAGMIGITAGILGAVLDLEGARLFVAYWVLVALVCLTVSFLMIRRQALKELEPFWTPPARRVAQAVAPAFFAGLVVAIVFFVVDNPVEDNSDPQRVLLLVPIWMVLYGLAMHAAGFFMPRGFRLFGWGFVGGGLAVLVCLIKLSKPDLTPPDAPIGNLAMGGLFGGGHAAYGLYLHFTKKRGNEA